MGFVAAVVSKKRFSSQEQVRQQVQTLTQKHQANLEHLGVECGVCQATKWVEKVTSTWRIIPVTK